MNHEQKKRAGFFERLLLQREGALTQDLLRSPGRFGLGQVPAKHTPDATTTAVCGYCSTGCGLEVHLQEGKAVNLSPCTDYPVNLGMACPKGWEALTVLRSDDRGKSPLILGGDGERRSIPWDDALRLFCERFKSIGDRHGPESVAFLSTGQIPTEEMALLGALTKFGMGMKHGDGNTRQCMASAVVAYKESFGFDAPPYTYQDFEVSDVIVLVGSNLCVAHPIMWERISRNPHRPEIIVVDPRVTETAAAATQHYPIAPKSDLTFFYGIAHLLIREGEIDADYIAAHTEGFEAFKEFVSGYTPEHVEAVSGIAAGDLLRLAETIAGGARVSFWWTMGVNQSHEGVRCAQALINLALMTGNIGRPGTGANSITGQCNAMGSRLFSNTTNLLGGHSFSDPGDRQKVARTLGIAEDRIPASAGWAYDQILEGIVAGKIKGLWVVATNPAHSWINQEHVKEVLGRLDFLVVQDMYHSTETAKLADLYLPAAGWGEKEGTFINSERRFGLLKKVAEAPGEALADFHIFKLIAEYWGCGDFFAEWTSPEAVFQLLKRLSRDQPCDFSGIVDYRMLDDARGIQWPYGAGCEDHAPERRLLGDGRFYHPDGRARFIFAASRPVAEPRDRNFPFTLLTGRGCSSQWHTQTRTQKSGLLRKLYPQAPYAELHPSDAKRLCIEPGSWVVVESRRGVATVRALITSGVQAGQVYIPMHYDVTNRLTYPAFDPHSRQPSYKSCAVALRPKERWEETPEP